MAKQKKASLKDKSPETLGLAPKKGKGMDLLFGGGLDKKQAGIDQAGEGEADLMGSSAPLEPALGGTRAEVAAGLVDELGLPVALEAPPDDLILASAPTDDEAETGDLAASPFAMPATDAQHDLSGITEDASAIGEEEKVSNANEKNNPPQPVEQG